MAACTRSTVSGPEGDRHVNDIASEIEAIHRTIGRRRIAAGDGRSVVLRRSYDAPVEDVWDACSDPDRLKRWFGSVSGDLRLGGKFQIEGNAGGEILRCEPPRLLAVSWVYGDHPADEVELRLTPEADGTTVVELEHAAAPGTVDDLAGVGVGWDLTLLALGMHLAGQAVDPTGLEQTPEYRRFVVLSSTAWGAALEAAGMATVAEADAVVERTTAFYAPEPGSGA
jgi:uncharacterized protein YndB with AHSA1/START domain